jgi:hypothetical protein
VIIHLVVPGKFLTVIDGCYCAQTLPVITSSNKPHGLDFNILEPGQVNKSFFFQVSNSLLVYNNCREGIHCETHICAYN